MTSLLLMTLQILGRNVAEVRVTHDCAALRRAARKGREAAKVAEPRRPAHDEEQECRYCERDGSGLESASVCEEVVGTVLPGRIGRRRRLEDGVQRGQIAEAVDDLVEDTGGRHGCEHCDESAGRIMVVREMRQVFHTCSNEMYGRSDERLQVSEGSTLSLVGWCLVESGPRRSAEMIVKS